MLARPRPSLPSRPSLRSTAPAAAGLAAWLLSALSASAQYCTAGAAACSTAGDEYIAQVRFNTINSLSGGPTGCYSDFTTLSTTISPGSAYVLKVNNPNGFGGDQAAAWIDWNQDGTFGSVASGEGFILTPDATSFQFSALIAVPSSATLGNTRLRIRMQYTGPLSPCGQSVYGEVEDYSITIIAATTGACCDNSGGCSATTPGECSGSFVGIGSGCLPSNPCGGACCEPGGACTVTVLGACPATSTFINHGTCSTDACVYCTAFSSACSMSTADERISSVEFANINNNSGPGDGPVGCYSDFTAFSADVLPGQSYTITVSNPSAFLNDAATVWIDWNHDFLFGSAATDEEYALTSDGTGASFTGSISVPATALPGPTRMRIRLLFNAVPLPCGGSPYGEVEDYTVNVTGTGTCCVNSACTFTTLDGCAGGIYTDGGSCAPNPCLIPGVCCRGSTCNTLVTNPLLCALSVAGTNAGGALANGSGACNPAANNIFPCCLTDYNKMNGTGVQDIFDYLNDWFMGSRFAVFHGNGAAGSPVVQDIFDYLNAWFAGGC